MRFKLFLMGAAAVLATSANATDWSGFSGTVTGGYNYSDVRGVASNAFDFGGAANYAIPDSHVNFQGAVDYSENKALRTPSDTWNTAGAMTWRDADIAVGLNGDYNSTRLYHQRLSYGSYGAFGEWYGLDGLGINPITLRLGGGGTSGTIGALNRDGGYLGAGATYYVLPQLSVTAHGSYNTFSNLHWSNFEVGAEVLPLASVPVSLSTSYVHDDIRTFGRATHSDGLMVRLALHLGNGTSLVEFDRNGPLNARTAQLPLDALTVLNRPL
ncbi:MAG: hypothetical protein P4L57_04555 [Rhizomicrobium sp.]|nr:hypothetical protein [Rhizomicrobium sp.]